MVLTLVLVMHNYIFSCRHNIVVLLLLIPSLTLAPVMMATK